MIGIDLCLRQDDCVVFIMPYLPHKRFSVSFYSFVDSILLSLLQCSVCMYRGQSFLRLYKAVAIILAVV